jgi:glycosyltransferase involved in cell wall biosynthesis
LSSAESDGMAPTIGFAPLYQIQHASSRYRVFQFVDPLRQLGYRCRVVRAPEKRFVRRLAYVPEILALALASDVLYVQKRMFPIVLLRALERLNPHMIFDLDDAIYLRPSRKPLIDAILARAALVVAGNGHLADYARHLNPRVMVIPSVVDTDLYLPRPDASGEEEDRVVVGWIGSDPNRGDLAPLEPVFDWLGRRYGDCVVLRTVGRRPFESETSLAREFVPWTLEGSLAALQGFDIGIMPLDDTAWNRGKCGFKLIEYMAVSIPAVASPVGVNTEIVQDGQTGYLATTLEEWQDRLALLIEDASMRRKMGQLGRERVERSYSIKAALPLLVDAVEQVAAMTRSDKA